MKSAAVMLLAAVLGAAIAVEVAAQATAPATGSGLCHYDCYGPATPAAGANAKTTLLAKCGVTNSKVVTTGLGAVYNQAPPTGCTVAACGYYANADALATYRNTCEHPDPLYVSNLQGKGKASYNAACNSC